VNDVPGVTMYSYAGPVIDEPSGFVAMGKVTVILKLAVSALAPDETPPAPDSRERD